MRPLDWAVLAGSLGGVVAYGLWRSRGSNTTDKYLLAGKTMPWYAMALSIMATQASAITFISTTGQSYEDGMRFVQMYFGLPLAMILISAFAVPVFYRTKVYTAYEYLEQRFDAKTRALVSFIFLIQRGLAVGVSIYAPAVVLTVILGWPDTYTTLAMGILVVFYTAVGGITAVTWTDFQQMMIMFAGLIAALVTALALMPAGVSVMDAVTLAGAAGRLNAVVLHFDWNDQYNLWSGLIGGMFLALAYFGCDQSQVQRYLTGKSLAQSRISLLFNAVAKIPMQFLILFIGAIVFVFYVFERPPLLFHPVEMQRVRNEAPAAEAAGLEQNFNLAFDRRRTAALELLQAKKSGDQNGWRTGIADYRAAQAQLDRSHTRAVELANQLTAAEIREESGSWVAAFKRHLPGAANFSDTNFIFLTFVTKYMPAGIVGLVLAMIFAAAMSSISAEINSLATVTVIDIYRRNIKKDASDRHYLWASRGATLFWGCYAVATAQYGKSLGSLIEAVNKLGSLFYGGMLGVFVLAFFFRRVGGTAAFLGVLAGEAAIFATHLLTDVSYLWYNVIGCLVVVATALLFSGVAPRQEAPDSLST
jgi:SSS family transporter